MFDLLCICLMIYTLDIKNDTETLVSENATEYVTQNDPDPCEWGYFVDFE